MIADVRACVPEALAEYGRRIGVCSRGCRATTLARLCEGSAFDALIGRFGAAWGPGADRRALVSLWTQYHFATLIIAAVTASMCLDRELPVAMEETFIEFDDRHRPARLLLASDGRPQSSGGTGSRFGRLVDAHLRPFIDFAADHVGLARRVLWGNAAVIFELSLRELARTRPVIAAARLDAEQRLAPVPRTGCRAACPLTQALEPPATDGHRRRRVCCLRYRLPGTADCGALCPVARGDAP